MADNSTHHRVYLPGPFVNDLPTVESHPAGCDLEACTVVDGLTTWLAKQLETVEPIQVEGDYFTTDGLRFERCAWQPERRR